MGTEYVAVKDLPEAVQYALESVGYGRRDIGTVTAERTEIGRGAMGDGYQGFTVLVDVLTGAVHTERGSWGGSNPFTSTPVDDDSGQYVIPPHGVVITGQRGGGRPVFATLHIPAAMRSMILPAATDDAPLTEDEERVIYAHRSLKGGHYRREYLERHRVSPDAIDAMIERGYVTRNRAGATAITTAGRNLEISVRW